MQEKIEFNSGNKLLDKARTNWNYVKDCDQEKSFRKDSISDVKYFTGVDQGWDDKNARNELLDEGRPVVTLNRVAPIYRLICGARPRIGVKFSPAEEGDLVSSSVLESCKEHIEDNSMWKFYEADWFLNGLLMRRGIVEIMPNFDTDPRGEIELHFARNSHKYWFDPDAEKKDRSDGMYVFKEENISPDEAKRKWPKLKDKIESMVDYVKGDTTGTTSFSSKEPDEYKDPRQNYYNHASKNLKILYYWYKEIETVVKLVDTETWKTYDSDKTKEDVEKALKGTTLESRYVVREFEYTSVKYLIFTHDIELERGDTPWNRRDGQVTFLSQNIPILCFEPCRIAVGVDEYLLSIGEDLKDPQKYHNKLASAIIGIIGTTAHSGWEYEDGAISKEEEKKLKKHGSKPGVNIKWAAGALSGQKARKIQPGYPPNAHVMEAREMSNEMLDISGVESLVNTESLGKGASGKAIDLKQRQGGNIISWVYESYNFFQHVLAMWERDAIQAMYDYEKVIRIRGTSKTQFVRINEQVYDEFGAISNILNDVTIGKYDIKTSDKDMFSSMRQERFMQFTEMVRNGALVLPPEVLIKIVMHFMDDPELKEIVEQEMGNYVAMAREQMGAGNQAVAV
jgi:hypothetical protein